MITVITMAGLGSRFKKAGYIEPKYMLEVHGKTLFEWSISSLKGFKNITEYIFIVRKEDKSHDFIVEKCKQLEIEQYKMIEINYLTKGQAETAMLAQKYWILDEELLIYNIDTYIEPYVMNNKEIKGDGFIPCFNAEGNHWSFVKTDIQERAIEVREKERISDNCTVGAYYFKTVQLYIELYQQRYSSDKNLDAGEQYIAPLYNDLILKDGNVYIQNISKEKVHVLGTPEELEFFQKYNFSKNNTF